MNDAGDIFSDYDYVPGEETTPQIGTNTGGVDWTDFINTTVRGITQVITTARQPANTLPRYTGSGTTGAGSATGPVSPNMLGLVVVGLLLFVLLK